MVQLVKLATCNLNQWAMDFDLNLKNVLDSIRQSRGWGRAVRVTDAGERSIVRLTLTRVRSLLLLTLAQASPNLKAVVSAPVLSSSYRVTVARIISSRKTQLDTAGRVCLRSCSRTRRMLV